MIALTEKFKLPPDLPKHPINGRTLFLVKWYDAELKEDQSQLVLALTRTDAKDVIWSLDDVADPKRITAVPINSEHDLRKVYKEEWDADTWVEDVRDYDHYSSYDLYGCNLDALLPLLREEWRKAENRAAEKAGQLRLFTVRKRANA